MKECRPTVVDLFAGAGLFSYAFKQTGFSIIRALEKDPIAATTYATNVGREIEVADVVKAKPIGKCDVLIAGPPCQGFSTLGRRRSNDPRNRLSLQVVRWTKILRPRVVVIENVTAFLGSLQHRRISKQLEDAGYRVDFFELNALDYGCPQIRRRSFTIANRDGIMLSPPRKRKRLRTVREAWEGLPSKPNGVNHHYSPQPSVIALARMRLIPPGGDATQFSTDTAVMVETAE